MLNELVSVIISTYNSSPYVIETLESVKNQTWQELELIISDDFSHDETVEICHKWLKKNEQRFTRAVVLTFEENTGVSANANRGLHAAKGTWIKFLAADDTLKTNCIEDNMAWITVHSEAKVLFSQIDIYKDTFEPHNLLVTTPEIKDISKGILAPDISAASQFRMLLLCDRIHFSPSTFLHRETILSIGGFDERFKMLEDYPMWLNLTKNGHKLYFMDKCTVNYRKHSKAINNTGRDYIVNPNYFRSEHFRRIYTYPYLPSDIKFGQRYNWTALQIFRLNWLNKDKGINRFLFRVVTIYLNPFRYYIWLRKKLNTQLIDNEFYK